MIIATTAEGMLSGRITFLSIEDSRPSLAFDIDIPILIENNAATLSVELRYPEVRSWCGLAERSYYFDESNRHYEQSDGETYARDDVFGDIRTATNYYNTFITEVTFGVESSQRLPVTVKGTVNMSEGFVPFTVNAQVKVSSVVLEDEDESVEETTMPIDKDAYHPAVVRDGLVTYEPRF